MAAILGLKHLNHFEEHGWVKFENLIPSDVIARHNSKLLLYRQKYQCRRGRIGQLHQLDPSLINIVTLEPLISFLHGALQDSPSLMGSLNFEFGTEQDTHIDTIFFCPSPLTSMVGVWVALEDVGIDNGPLFVYDKSHKIPFLFPKDVADCYPDFKIAFQKLTKGCSDSERLEIISTLGGLYGLVLKKRLSDAGLEKVVFSDLRAGDVVVWHSFLAHGGSPVVDSLLTRKSAVFHFLGRNSSLFDFNSFFTVGDQSLLESQGLPRVFGCVNDLSVQRFDYFVTHDDIDGSQTLHDLEVR